MTSIIIEISTYILLSILLGCFFGWLITREVLKKRYEVCLNEIALNNNTEIEEINKIKDELFQTKKENKRLKSQNKELHSGYGEQKYVLDEHNATLDEFQERLHSKDEAIEILTGKLSFLENEHSKIEKKHEKEIDAFMFERTEITQKYKNLLEKENNSSRR